MKIESTTVEMFWKEKILIFSALIANICPEKIKNSLKLKKTAEWEEYHESEMSFRGTYG